MTSTIHIVDPRARGYEHIRRMADGNRVPFLRGVIDSISENGSAQSRKELREALDQLFATASAKKALPSTGSPRPQ